MGFNTHIYYTLMGVGLRNKRRKNLVKYLIIDAWHALVGRKER